MKEIWKDIDGYEKLYQCSNIGRIRSLKFGKVRILKPIKAKCGYLQVGLCKDEKVKLFYVHRLVYETFVGSIPEGMQVNHINEDKTDNRYPENLNLMTRKENTNWGTGNQRRSEKLRNNTNRSQAVRQSTLDGEFVCIWSSTAEAARNGFDQSCVSRCCNGKRKSHKGFIFEYI